MHDLIIAGAERLQFRPAIDLPFDEAAALNRFEHAIIVEIGQAAVPSPAAAGEAELFAGVIIGRNVLLHYFRMSCRKPEEVAFGEAELRRDVAHINIEVAVAIDIAEIAAHSLER